MVPASLEEMVGRVVSILPEKEDSPVEAVVLALAGGSLTAEVAAADRRRLGEQRVEVWCAAEGHIVWLEARALLCGGGAGRRRPVLELVPLGRPERVQARQWLRGGADGVGVDVEGHPSAGLAVVDLSGGGARLAGLTGVEPGQRLELTFVLPRGPVGLIGRVLQVGAEAVVRIRFEGASEAATARITRHVFEAQLGPRRRRGRGG